MFCLKCGEAIPDGSEKCPLCGADLKSENSEQAVVYASQKEPPESSVVNEAESNLKKSFIGVMIAAVYSFIFLSMNYMSVSIKLLYYGILRYKLYRILSDKVLGCNCKIIRVDGYTSYYCQYSDHYYSDHRY